MTYPLRCKSNYCLESVSLDDLTALSLCALITSVASGGGGGSVAATAASLTTTSPATGATRGFSTIALATNTLVLTATLSKAAAELRFVMLTGGVMAAVLGLAM
jgi:hypothetical protein